MITLTRADGVPFALNPDLIERVDPGVETVVVLVDGTRYAVVEAVSEVVRRVRAAKAAVVALSQHVEGDPDVVRLRRLWVVPDGD